ncbi:MAG: tRNA uridine-5-carboxymethylaminomethyl(34) synthesis GTPase MnmE [Myxococcales bacterium]|nr:tRNA uridine-5-carboxymethylaminomethyl(34) synthesis GTPase MnmE [Myxococcales bacterium]
MRPADDPGKPDPRFAPHATDDETIVANATPGSYGALSVLRISGSRTIAVVQQIFEPLPDRFRQQQMYYGRFRDPEREDVLDEGYVVVMHAPQSYTGEDVAELSIHGGAVNVRRMLDAIRRCGVRLAEQGEFTKRAFLNGRIDLTQAEAVVDLLNAKTEASLDLALRQLEGRLSETLGELRAALIGVRSALELNIDFIEEDVPIFEAGPLVGQLDQALEAIRTLLESYERGRIYRDGLQLAIVGRPNVGKSSLFNALLREHRAIVTPIPGTTRDVLQDTANLRGVPVQLADTAGIHDAGDTVERIGIERSRAQVEHADLLLLVLDPSESLSAADEEIIATVTARPHLVVLNKSDLSPAWDNTRFAHALRVSALTAAGLEELIDRIVDIVGARDPGHEQSVVLTNARHRDLLERAAASLERAREALVGGEEPEFVTVDVQETLDAIGAISGMTTPDEWLNKIFSQFCIGK